MFGNLSVKVKLAVVAVAATVGAITLAGFNLYSGRVNSQALGQVYEENVHSLVQLQKIDAVLREVRFRVAGVLLDVMPVEGSLIHLRDSRKELDEAWDTVVAAGSTDPAERELLDQMGKGWSVVQATLGKIEQAYTASNNGRLTEVLETEWAVVHKGYIKPLASLLPLKEAGAKATYERSSATNATLTGASIVLAIALTCLILVVVVWVMRSITTSLHDAVNMARQVADGDLSTTIIVDRHDEMGRLLQALAEMQGSLRRVVGEVRSSVEGHRHGLQRDRGGQRRSVAAHRGAGLVARGDGLVDGGAHHHGEAERRQRAPGQPACGAAPPRSPCKRRRRWWARWSTRWARSTRAPRRSPTSSG